MFWKKHPRFLGIIAAGPIVWHNNISFSTVQYSRVEWFSTFCDFQNWTHCCQSVQFQNQKINKLGRARKVFIFKKFTGTLKIKNLNRKKRKAPKTGQIVSPYFGFLTKQRRQSLRRKLKKMFLKIFGLILG